MNEKESKGLGPRFGKIANIFLAGMAFVPALALGYACGGSSQGFADGGNGGGSSGASSGASGGGSGGASSGNSSGISFSSSGGASSSGNPMGTGTANGTFNAPDCAGCTFPPLTATACASSAPAIKVVYPNNGVLVPPNMNVISVQWTPFGGYKTFEVDFANSVTDTRVITKCATQTMDTSQPVQASGGCDLELPQAAWTLLTGANRGGAPVVVTVRGSTDGTCATKSQDSIKMSFATEDLLGAIYYWKSTVTSNGTGGQIWEKNFGDMVPEKQVTGTAGSALSASCNGCHVLSRDGQRMVVYSDDDDSDDEYSDVLGSLIDMGANVVVGGTGGGRVPGTQPPGFSTISPTHTSYLTSDGLGTAPTNNFVLYNGNTAATTGTITFGAAGDRPTMPDWSPDGKEVVYVLPNKVASWDTGGFNFGGGRADDDHMFGGSLYKLPYNGNGQFGTPAVFLQSAGENNYYPSFSPDGQYIVFDRAPASTAVSAIDGCNGSSPHVTCPNDSFSNPAARLMLVTNVNNAKVIDLQNANGSPAAGPLPLSNSWPRWSPFVQTYKGGRLLWVAFSSTRDYGLLVRNHLAGMYQCYPADSYQLAGGAHHSTFDPLCQQPKLWMAAINLSESPGTDPSFPAFYLPFQDITTHNHTPQWTQQVVTMPPVDAGACIPTNGNCLMGGSCCAGLACNGNGTCITVVP